MNKCFHDIWRLLIGSESNHFDLSPLISNSISKFDLDRSNSISNKFDFEVNRMNSISRKHLFELFQLEIKLAFFYPPCHLRNCFQNKMCKCKFNIFFLFFSPKTLFIHPFRVGITKRNKIFSGYLNSSIRRTLWDFSSLFVKYIWHFEGRPGDREIVGRIYLSCLF